MTPSFTPVQIAAFLKWRLRSLKAAGTGRRARELLLTNIGWHIGRNHLVCITEKDKISGVGIARGIDRIEDARFQHRFNDQGKILYIEHVAADTNIAFKHLLLWARKRWPHADKLLFHRLKSGSRNKIYNLNEFILKACL